jgi:hypothetical protein
MPGLLGQGHRLLAGRVDIAEREVESLGPQLAAGLGDAVGELAAVAITEATSIALSIAGRSSVTRIQAPPASSSAVDRGANAGRFRVAVIGGSRDLQETTPRGIRH